MPNVYNKLDIVVNIAFQYDFYIGPLKSVNMNYIEIRANCYIDTISS